jgi:CubicO group peptidase (beta-lactamase class C family)
VTDRVSRQRYVLDHCRRRLLIQPPGSGFSYSNLGYVLAGYLVESVTGMGWSEAMESILLRPLGIDPVFVSTGGPGGSGGPAARPVATGHSVQVAAGRTRPVQQCLSRAEAPAGGLAVSAADLVTLGLLHVPPGVPGLLPATAAERMRRAVPVAERLDIADGWALGLGIFRPDPGEWSGPVERLDPVEWFGHDGNGNGTACYFRVDPAGGRVVALTSNASTGYDLWQDLLDELGRAGLPIGRHRSRTSTRSVPAPAGCPGRYRNGDLEYAVSGTPDGLLRIAVDGDRFDRVACHDDLTFALPDPASAHRAVTGRFVRDRVSGRIDGLLLGGRLARRNAVPAHGSSAHGSQPRLTA